MYPIFDPTAYSRYLVYNKTYVLQNKKSYSDGIGFRSPVFVFRDISSKTSATPPVVARVVLDLGDQETRRRRVLRERN